MPEVEIKAAKMNAPNGGQELGWCITLIEAVNTRIKATLQCLKKPKYK
jgi:hypothetical protein